MTEIKAAVLSDCGKYRFQLTRDWSAGPPRLPFVMLNPSTADDKEDDPTIRKCMKYARREGAGGIIVANVFAFRATSPKDLFASVYRFNNLNCDYLNQIGKLAAATDTPVVCAWGAHASKFTSDGVIMRLRSQGARLACLGVTKEGHPRHPLYVRDDQALIPF